MMKRLLTILFAMAALTASAQRVYRGDIEYRGDVSHRGEVTMPAVSVGAGTMTGVDANGNIVKSANVTFSEDSGVSINRTSTGGGISNWQVSDDLFGLNALVGAAVEGIGHQYKLNNSEWVFVKTSDDAGVGGDTVASVGYINLTNGAENFVESTNESMRMFAGGPGYGTQLRADVATGRMLFEYGPSLSTNGTIATIDSSKWVHSTDTFRLSAPERVEFGVALPTSPSGLPAGSMWVDTGSWGVDSAVVRITGY